MHVRKSVILNIKAHYLKMSTNLSPEGECEGTPYGVNLTIYHFICSWGKNMVLKNMMYIRLYILDLLSPLMLFQSFEAEVFWWGIILDWKHWKNPITENLRDVLKL